MRIKIKQKLTKLLSTVLTLSRRALPRRNLSLLILFLSFVTVGILVLSAKPVSATVLQWVGYCIAYVAVMFAQLFMALTVFLLRFFIQLGGYNGYLDAPIVKVGWVMVRDVANMFFVVALLVIAFATILGRESYEWKKTMAKLVLMAIFINFSMLFCGVVIDVAHVFTVTFLNAIAPAAGGNLINMFNLDKIQSIVAPNSIVEGTGIMDGSSDQMTTELFLGAVMSVTFAAIAMFTIGAYTVTMLVRMVVLWIAIILSPLAFVLSVLPNTQNYAKEWWEEFTKHVLVAPIMVFFLWLAFATMGDGSVASHIGTNSKGNEFNESNDAGDSGQTVASFNLAATWSNMAGFLVAVGFLIVGIERVQKLGVKAGGLAGGALDFGKKVAMVASGAASARWLGGKGASVGKAAGIGLGKRVLGVGGKESGLRLEQRWKTAGAYMKNAYYGKGSEVTSEGKKIAKQLYDKEEALKRITGETDINNDKKESVRISKEIQDLQEQKGKTTDAKEQAKIQEVIDIQVEAKKEVDKNIKTAEDIAKKPEPEKKAEIQELEKSIKADRKKLEKESGGGWVGKMARRDVAYAKQLGKVEAQAEVRKKVLFKRTGTEGMKMGLLLSMPGRAIGFRDTYAGVSGQDRIERGWLQAEEARGRAKDIQYESQGKLEVMSGARLKYNAKNGSFGYEFKNGTMAEMVEEHKIKGEDNENLLHSLETKAKEKAWDKSQKTIDEIDNRPELKAIAKKIDELNTKERNAAQYIEALESIMAARKYLENNGGTDENETLFRQRREKEIDNEEVETVRLISKRAELAQMDEEIEKDRKNNRSSKPDLINEKASLEAQIVKEENEEKIDRKKKIHEEWPVAEVEQKRVKEEREKRIKAIRKAQAVLTTATDPNDPNSKPIFGLDVDLSKITESDLQSKKNNLEQELKQAQKSHAEQNENKATTKARAIDKILSQERKEGRAGLAYWAMTSSKVVDDEEKTNFSHRDKQMQNDAEQVYVWDEINVQVPNTALVEAAEKFKTSLADMNYDSAVNAVKGYLDHLQKKKGDKTGGGELDFAESVKILGFLQKLKSGEWIDDAIDPLSGFTPEQQKAMMEDFANQLQRKLEGAVSPEDFKKIMTQLTVRKSKRSSPAGGEKMNLNEPLRRDLAELLKQVLNNDFQHVGTDSNKLNMQILDALPSADVDKEMLKRLNLPDSGDKQRLAREIAELVSKLESDTIRGVISKLPR